MKRIAFVHYKCGSMWINAIFNSIASVAGRRHRYLFGRHRYDIPLPELLNEGKIEYVTYANPDNKDVELLGDFIAFNIIRDPRDIIISGYFSHKNTHYVKKGKQMYKLRKN